MQLATAEQYVHTSDSEQSRESDMGSCCVCLFLLQLFELAQLQQCPEAKVVHFDKVIPITRTPAFCGRATDDAGVTTTADKGIGECSRECASSAHCVAFNHRQPQLVCELFETPFSSLSPIPGCTHYEVQRPVRRSYYYYY